MGAAVGAEDGRSPGKITFSSVGAADGAAEAPPHGSKPSSTEDGDGVGAALDGADVGDADSNGTNVAGWGVSGAPSLSSRLAVGDWVSYGKAIRARRNLASSRFCSVISFSGHACNAVVRAYQIREISRKLIRIALVAVLQPIA